MAKHIVIIKATGTKYVELDSVSATKYVYLLTDFGSGTNLISNGGGPNTTDWTNPTDGLAQDWNAVVPP